MEELRQSFIEQGFEIVPHDYTFVDCAATPSMILNELRAARTGAKETPARKAQTKPQRAAPSKQAQAKPKRAAPAKKKPKR